MYGFVTEPYGWRYSLVWVKKAKLHTPSIHNAYMGNTRSTMILSEKRIIRMKNPLSNAQFVLR